MSTDRKIGDLILFTWTDKGERIPVAPEPKGRKENANFLIVYRGRDWSGFLTYSELLGRMEQIERSTEAERRHLFDAVERT